MEEWKDIEGFDGQYQVSSYGRVKSLPWYYHHREDIILKPINQNSGYLQVALYSKQKPNKKYLIHRLVAEAFLEHDSRKNHVNHKDGNKHNNNVENLEWVTQSENNLHAIYVLSKKGKTAPRRIKCVETGKVYKSVAVAARAVGGNRSNIWSAASGKLQRSSKLHWEFVD